MTTTPIEPQAAANTDEPLSSSELANKLDALYKIIRDNGNELSWGDPDRIKAKMKRAWELAAVLRISASRLRTTPAASQHSDLADRLEALLLKGPTARTPWTVKGSGGKPLISSKGGGNLFQGFIATWNEAEILVELANNLPTILNALRHLTGTPVSRSSEYDLQVSEMAIDSGMDGESIAGAEAFWAGLPTGRKWTSLKTYEKALVCHQMDRLEAALRQPPSDAMRNAAIEECAVIAETLSIGGPTLSSWVNKHESPMEATQRHIAAAIRALTQGKPDA